MPRKKQPADVATSAGRDPIANFEAAANVANSAAPDNHAAPRLRLAINRHWRGRLWATVERVDCQYSVDLADLDQPCFLAARIAHLALDMRGDDGRSYAIQIMPVLERLLIGPHHTFAQWEATIDEALAAIGMVAA